MSNAPTWLTLLLAVASGLGLGSVILAIVNHILGRKQNVAEIDKTNIENAMKLRDAAIGAQDIAEKNLTEARKQLDLAAAELRKARGYIEVLQGLLDERQVKYPDYDKYKKTLA